MKTRKKILIIAGHYPPCGQGSGVLRTLKFSKYLPEFGWQPIVLTANPRIHKKRSTTQLQEIPKSVVIINSFALDASRHLAIFGSYPRILALPDRVSSWTLGGLYSGINAIKKYQPDIIFSTYPFATAHLIGLLLHKYSGIPWVTDFRDPMTLDDHPNDRWVKRSYQWIEKKAMEHSCLSIFTTPSSQHLYEQRYPQRDLSKFSLIANGYDEADFDEIERSESKKCQENDLIRLIHSGLLYSDIRDPLPFFYAIRSLKEKNMISVKSLQVILRGAGNSKNYKRILEDFTINDIVILEDVIPYKESLQELFTMDGLLIFQGSQANFQVPAKLYEYFRTRKPILALTDLEGDTARTMQMMNYNDIVNINNSEAIEDSLISFIKKIKARWNPPNFKNISIFSRYHQSEYLSKKLSSLIKEGA